LEPLPGAPPEPARLATWFRRFVDVRDAEGAERALVSAVRGGASPTELADMLFAAATDHRYLDGGHTLDFVNKALEALDVAGWDRAEPVLASLPTQLAGAERMEEANAWRNPVDLVTLLERAFEELPDALAAGAERRGTWEGRAGLVEVILGSEACSTRPLASTSTDSSTCRPRGCRRPSRVPTRTRSWTSSRACSTGSSRWTRPGSSPPRSSAPAASRLGSSPRSAPRSSERTA